MGKRVLHTHKQRSGKPVLRAAGLLGVSLLCLPLASAAGRFGADVQDGIAVVGVGMQDPFFFLSVPIRCACVRLAYFMC